MDENSKSKISNPAQPLIRSWRSIYPREDFTNAFVIGLAGLALSGKTTVAEAVLAELSRQAPAVKAIKLSFASRMKEVLVALVGKEHSFQTPEEKETILYGDGNWSVRDFLNSFGTDFIRRQLGDNFWIDIMAKQLSELTEATVVVIDDVRFPGEAALIKPLGLVVLMERSGIVRTINHSTEHPENLDVDARIQNDATPREAAEAVLELARAQSFWPI